MNSDSKSVRLNAFERRVRTRFELLTGGPSVPLLTHAVGFPPEILESAFQPENLPAARRRDSETMSPSHERPNFSGVIPGGCVARLSRKFSRAFDYPTQHCMWEILPNESILRTVKR